MNTIIEHLNKRVIEINDKMDNATSNTMDILQSGRMMEAELMMQTLIDQGIAELDDSSELIGWMQIRRDRRMQVKLVG